MASSAVLDLASGEPGTPSPDGAAFLAFLAAVCGKRTMVEVGSAGGVTAGALVAGQRSRGIVTSIESDRSSHDVAVARLATPISEGRVRLMNGAISEVLARLSDDGYGLALLQHDPADYDRLLDEVLRLLEPDGVLLARGVLAPEHADQVAPFLQRVAERATSCTIIDLDGGLLMATVG